MSHLSTDLESVRLLFDGRRLSQARQFQGLLKAEVAARVGVTPAAIGQFESGGSRPSTATIGKLGLALMVPPGYFAAGRPLFLLADEDAHFRSLRSTSKRDRTRARAQVERLAEVVQALEQRVRLPMVDLPELHEGCSAEDAARITRTSWGLGVGPLRTVVGVLERRGVVVARLPSATAEVDAFSAWVGQRPYVVLASNKSAADRSRFDAAHELGHLLLHPDARPGDAAVEREAHRFAAEFLIPAVSIEAELPVRLDWPAYAALKLRWGTSIAMLIRRARDVGLISDASYRRAMVEIGRRGWRSDEPVSLGVPEAPELLGRAMALLQARRDFTVDDLASELALGTEGLLPYQELLRPVAVDRLVV